MESEHRAFWYGSRTSLVELRIRVLKRGREADPLVVLASSGSVEVAPVLPQLLMEVITEPAPYPAPVLTAAP